MALNCFCVRASLKQLGDFHLKNVTERAGLAAHKGGRQNQDPLHVMEFVRVSPFGNAYGSQQETQTCTIWIKRKSSAQLLRCVGDVAGRLHLCHDISSRTWKPVKTAWRGGPDRCAPLVLWFTDDEGASVKNSWGRGTIYFWGWPDI